MEEKKSIQYDLYLVKLKVGCMLSDRVSNQSEIMSKISTTLHAEVFHQRYEEFRNNWHKGK